MGEQGFDPSAPWARIVVDHDVSLRRAGTSARQKENELRARGFKRALQLLRGEPGEDFSWGKGAAGEELLGTALHRLPSRDWTVVHDQHLDGTDANVDHIVVGPPGIFSLNTKNLAGNVWVAPRTFMVNGVKQDYLWKAKREAERVARLLERGLGRRPAVRPVIVVIAPKVTVKEHPTDVSVVQARELVPWLMSLAPTIGTSELESFGRAVRHESTWDPRVSPPRVIDYVPAHTKGERLPRATDDSDAVQFTFTPRRRYGKKRIYIKDCAGADIGYYDEISKEFQLVETAPTGGH